MISAGDASAGAVSAAAAGGGTGEDPAGGQGAAGGSVATAGATTGGIAMGGMGGLTSMGGTGGTAMGGALDAEAGAGSAGDGGVDIPPFADSNLPRDQAMGGTGGTFAVDAGTSADSALSRDGGMDAAADISRSPDLGTGGSGGAGTGGAGGNGGTGGIVADAAIAPMIISIDFVGGTPPVDSGTTGTVAMAATETAGYRPAANWNSAEGNAGTLASLKLADGTATSASAVWNSPVAANETWATWTLSFADAPGDVRMMNGYLDPRATASPATVSVTGLASPMSSGYDVYVYCFGDMTWADTRTYQYTIGSTTHTVTQTEPPLVTSFSGYTLAPEAGAGNYVVFKSVTGTSFTLKATPGSSLYQTVRAPINGIQIVYPSSP